MKQMKLNTLSNVLSQFTELSDNTKAEILTKSLHMTDKEFQQHLSLMRLHNQPSKEKKLNPTTLEYKVNGQFTKLSESGNNETNYTYYVKFINDILKNLRKGEIDYCYYIGQVRELLRFIPDLKVKLCEFYFEVSI